MKKPRKPVSKKKKKAETAEEDLSLWRAVVQTVEPLKGRDLPPEDIGVKPRPKTRPIQPVQRPPAPPPAAPLPPLSHADQPGLDKATAKRLRRGRARLEGRIDLHGLTQGEAHAALDRFLENAVLAGKREVLVITGKGTRTDGSIGVLRQAVPRWLNESPNRNRVVAFSYAAPKDGGEGALYVRLKKRD